MKRETNNRKKEKVEAIGKEIKKPRSQKSKRKKKQKEDLKGLKGIGLQRKVGRKKGSERSDKEKAW